MCGYHGSTRPNLLPHNTLWQPVNYLRQPLGPVRALLKAGFITYRLIKTHGSKNIPDLYTNGACACNLKEEVYLGWGEGGGGWGWVKGGDFYCNGFVLALGGG